MHCTSTSVRMMLTVVFRCSTLLLGWLSDRPAATHGWSLLPVVPVTTPWNGRGPASRRFRIQRERRPHHDLALRLSNRNNNNNWNNQLDETGRRKAQSGIGETAAGAVLGGLLLGPFGESVWATVRSVGAEFWFSIERKDLLWRARTYDPSFL